MTREGVGDEILQVKSPHVLVELPTGFGKSKVALDLIKHYIDEGEFEELPSILIVIPRLVLPDGWRKELDKWGYKELESTITFVTYVSFPKKAGHWDIVVFDEAHHLSPRCREALSDFDIRKVIMLSATVGRKLKEELNILFPDLYTYKVPIKKAIQEEILPDPRVFLIPLTLDRTNPTFEIVRNASQRVELRIPYRDKFRYINIKNRKIIIQCTQSQYYNEMSAMIAWYKKKSFMTAFKNLFLRKSGERLKWLSDQKSGVVKQILGIVANERTLTFCNGVAHTEELGKYCINSENKESQENLNKFNAEKVNHITACNMLDEGVNLVNCRVGIYAVLNSSERMIKQKLGRLLRHPSPIIIIPYYKGTRDQEIVEKMLEDYNPQLVKEVTLEELKNEI